MRKLHFIPALFATVSLGACLGGNKVETADPSQSADVTPVPDPPVGSEITVSGVENSFEHFMDERDPFDIIKQKTEEGPPTVSTRLHSCQKVTYQALGALLASRGVDLGAAAKQGQPPTAGQLYRAGAQALGAPNYGARTREPTQLTTAGATKLMDIFIQAAPEIVRAMPGLKSCQIDGKPAQMFDGSGGCTLDGIACLIGAPATQQHVAMCNQVIGRATTTAIGQTIAVASILAAAHTCE
jgi:hypothetical protein